MRALHARRVNCLGVRLDVARKVTKRQGRLPHKFAPMGSRGLAGFVWSGNMPNFSDADKLAEIRRELALRRRTYPIAIKRKMLSPHAAAYHLRVFEAIEADY